MTSFIYEKHPFFAQWYLFTDQRSVKQRPSSDLGLHSAAELKAGPPCLDVSLAYLGHSIVVGEAGHV